MNDAQAELLRDKYVLWERASREGPMDLRDYNRRAAEALKAALAICAQGPVQSSWLIEWLADRQRPARYWHATEGHVIDPGLATRFARREDAEAMRRRDHLIGGCHAVEHLWVEPV